MKSDDPSAHAHEAPHPHPPEASAAVQRVVNIFARPVDRFMKIEAASGILLIVSALAALFWANSPWAESYKHLWHTQIHLGIGDLVFSRDLHFWISDGLMVIFFFVVGLEIRREIHQGELSEPKRAALPLAAAVGGMAVPAIIYLVLNPSPEARAGWAVPTATDIAFAVGVLTLLGKRAPAALRVFLLAFAVIDDIGAILVIAIFYSSGIALSGLLIVLGGIIAILFMQRLGVRESLLYVAPGIVIWVGLLVAGIHPTIGGVILGLLTPAQRWFGDEGFLHVAENAMGEVRDKAQGPSDDTNKLTAPLHRLTHAARETQAPVLRLEHALHPWVAFVIMPLFALSNAGVSFGSLDLASPAALGIALGAGFGLILGKLIGVVGGSLLAVRLRLCRLPRGIGFRELVVAGMLGGIGFTMAIFIAILAFESEALLGVAKLAVFVASALAAIFGLIAGRLLLPASQDPELAAITAGDAEASTDY